MFLPLGTTHTTRRTPRVTPALISACVLAHLAIAVALHTDPSDADAVYRALQVGGPDPVWWGAVTSLFVHGSLIHLLGNMLFLWVFGPPVEDRMGRAGFLAFYFAGGIASGLAHSAFEAAPAIGASGAVSGVQGAFLVLFPRLRVRVLWFFSIFLVPAWWFIGLGIAWDFFSQSLGVRDNIARLAHLGGYGFGAAVSLLLLKVGVFPREPYDLLTLFTQAKRRRAFRAASEIKPAPVRVAARSPKEQAQAEKLAAMRSRVLERVTSGDLEGASGQYAALLEAFPDDPAGQTLSRDAHYALAAYLAGAGRHEEAAAMLSRFLGAYPNDREAPGVRVLLGRLRGRYLGQPDEARALLTLVIEGERDESLVTLAQEELALLGDGDNA